MKIIGRGWYTGSKNYDTGAGFAISVKKEDRDTIFKREWKDVILELEGFDKKVEVNIDKYSFWNKCPELYHLEIGKWLKEKDLIRWPKGKPPKMELEQIKDNYFKVRLIS